MTYDFEGKIASMSAERDKARAAQDEERYAWYDGAISALEALKPKANEELERKREELFEVFRAGYKAGLEDGTNRHGYDADSAFQDWLDEQFAEVSLPEGWVQRNEECPGSGHLPRSVGETLADGTLTGMCISCQEFLPMDEVIPPSNPDWRREFRLRAHTALQIRRDA